MNSLGGATMDHMHTEASTWDDCEDDGALSRFADRCPSAMACVATFCLLVLGFLTATMVYAHRTLPEFPSPPTLNPSAWGEYPR
ncbi:MAG: hypothetical protein U0836_10755 [Pirellulales bacterium]